MNFENGFWRWVLQVSVGGDAVILGEGSFWMIDMRLIKEMGCEGVI